MAHSHDKNDHDVVRDVIHDAIVANPDPKAWSILQLL
jgi:hypothetical protein